MRQKIRKILLYVSLFLFPITMNFLSPYVSLDGAFAGVLSGSAMMFLVLFVSGMFFGRAWCGWLCPAGGIAEVAQTVNPKPANTKRLRIVHYSIFTLWFGVLVTGFVLAGGVKGIDPLRLTEKYVSVDEPIKYIMYYLVLGSFFVLDPRAGAQRRLPRHLLDEPVSQRGADGGAGSCTCRRCGSRPRRVAASTAKSATAGAR